MTSTQTVCLAGVGDLGRYLLEEISADDRYNVVVLTRQKDKIPQSPKVSVHETDYSEDSLLSILNDSGSTVLISIIRCMDADYVPLHQGFLNACLRSKQCKRFLPSEWAGNIEDYPAIPRAYGKTRQPFREILRQTQGIEWTLFSPGWLMDYFVPANQTYITHHPGEFPINLKSWEYTVRGTGNEPQSWTCGRDIAKAVTELLAASEWEPVTYIAGEWGTYNEAAKLMETFYARPFTSTKHRSESEIMKSLEEHKNDAPDSTELALAEGEEWQISGAASCPEEKTLRQRSKYFSGVHFRSIKEILSKAQSGGYI